MKDTITLHNVLLTYPSAYTMAKSPNGTFEKYSVGVEITMEQAKDLPGAVRMKLREDGGCIINASSKFPIRISSKKEAISGTYDDLVKALQIADARNIPRDRLLINQVADVVIFPYPYSHSGYSGVGLGIEEIKIDPWELLNAAMSESE